MLHLVCVVNEQFNISCVRWKTVLKKKFSWKCFNCWCEGICFLKNYWVITCITTTLFWREISGRIFILNPLFGGSVFVDKFVPTESSSFYPQDFDQFKSITTFFIVQSLIIKLVFQKLWVLSQFWGIWISSFLANAPIKFHTIREEICARRN